MMKAKAVDVAEHPDATNLGVLDDMIIFHLRRVQRILSRRLADAVSGLSGKPGVFTALALISANPGLSQTELAREIGFDKATVVSIIDDLEERGWALRERAEGDRRRHCLALTRAGEAALKRWHQIAQTNEAVLHSELSPQELTRLVDLLDRAYVCLINEAK